MRLQVLTINSSEYLLAAQMKRSLASSGEEVLSGDLSLGELLLNADALLEAEVLLGLCVHQLVVLGHHGCVAVEQATVQLQEVSQARGR